MKQQSARRRRERESRSRCMEQVLQRDRVCRACGTAPAQEVHELGRGQWRRFCYLEPEACLGLCAPCHMWVTLNPEPAIEQGLAWDAGTAERWLRERGLLKTVNTC